MKAATNSAESGNLFKGAVLGLKLAGKNTLSLSVEDCASQSGFSWGMNVAIFVYL
jgi:hypothetical protein